MCSEPGPALTAGERGWVRVRPRTLDVWGNTDTGDAGTPRSTCAGKSRLSPEPSLQGEDYPGWQVSTGTEEGEEAPLWATVKCRRGEG